MGPSRSLVLLLAFAACSGPKAQDPEERLAAALSADRILKLDRASFDQIVVEPFRSLYADYVREMYTPPREPLAIRRHFANDTTLTRAQVRLRWALPVMYPSYVAGDSVFVEVHGEWRTLSGLDEALLARVRALDPICADRLALAGPPGPCTDAGWVIADAALRMDTARFTRACQLAGTACIQR